MDITCSGPFWRLGRTIAEMRAYHLIVLGDESQMRSSLFAVVNNMVRDESFSLLFELQTKVLSDIRDYRNVFVRAF